MSSKTDLPYIGTGQTGGTGGSDDCPKEFRGIKIAAPKDISKLNINDELNLEVREEAGHPVLHVLKAGEDMGTIISRSAVKIVDCIKRGKKYVAKVVQLDGGDCTLDVKMKGSV